MHSSILVELKKIVLLAFVLVLLSTTMFVRFVRQVAAEGTVYIRSDGSIEGTDKIQREGNVYIFTENIYDEIVVQRDNIVVDGAGYTLQGTGGLISVGIGLTERNNVTIRNMEITEFYYGIGFWASSNNTLSGNNITVNNQDGIYFDNSSNNTISGNKITANNQDGIYLVNSSNNTVSGNNVSNNYRGIWLSTSSNNNIVGNNITANNWDGITLYDSSYNRICGNNITVNYRDGIGLYASSSINNIQRNNMVNNQYGIELYDFSNHNSICENNIANNNRSIWLSTSSFTSIYHNNFVNNIKRVATLSSVLNVWDDGYPSGGNYWSDYIATANDTYFGLFQNETGNDGIADTPFVIDSNNQDNYPLIGMFSDFNATLECHVQTICNSSISDFQFSGTAIYFNVSGEDGTIGFCRICIPRALMNETYKVFVNGTEVSYTSLPFSNSTHSYLYFTYNHSTQEVIIISEFPAWTSMLLILIVLTVAFAIYKQRLLKTPIH